MNSTIDISLPLINMWLLFCEGQFHRMTAATCRFSASLSPTYSITVLWGNRNGPRVVLIIYADWAPSGEGAERVVFWMRLRANEISIVHSNSELKLVYEHTDDIKQAPRLKYRYCLCEQSMISKVCGHCLQRKWWQTTTREKLQIWRVFIYDHVALYSVTLSIDFSLLIAFTIVAKW